MMKNARKFGAFAAMTAAVMCASDALAIVNMTGRLEVTDDASIWGAVGELGNGADTVVHQTNYNVFVSGTRSCGNNDVMAYLLEGGKLSIESGSYWLLSGIYNHFRQTGGEFWMNKSFHRAADKNTEDTLPIDLIFSGNALSTNAVHSNGWNYNGNFLHCDYNLVVMDNAKVDFKTFGKNGGLADYVRHVAINGDLTMLAERSMNTNTFYSFNGGTLVNKGDGHIYGYNAFFGNASTKEAIIGTNVKIYEGGGCASFWCRNNDGTPSFSSGNYSYLPQLLAPVGNVVKSVVLTAAARNNNGAGWDFPPAVVIRDATGAGSNAVAFVDYDFVNRIVTNVVIACGGENYSGTPGDVTAELRYKATGDALATLDCTVGECHDGGFTFGGPYSTYTMIQQGYLTNTYCGTTTMDLDPEGFYDIEFENYNDYRGGVLRLEDDSMFANTTNLVMRSGLVTVRGISSGDRRHFGRAFPACRSLELYGGYLAAYGAYNGWFNLDRLVVGGRAWLQSRKSTSIDLGARIGVSGTGTLIVDTSCMTNGVTPELVGTDTPETELSKCGRVKFDTGATVTVRNWKSIPKGRWQTILELSSVWVNRAAYSSPTAVPGKQGGTGVPGIVLPADCSDDDLSMRWEFDDRGDPIRLLARRPSDGMFLIFR